MKKLERKTKKIDREKNSKELVNLKSDFDTLNNKVNRMNDVLINVAFNK